MKKCLMILGAVQFILAGCAGHKAGTGFKPITSNGEQCLSNCETRKAQCLARKGLNSSESDRNTCEEEYAACLKPCIDFDEMIKKAF